MYEGSNNVLILQKIYLQFKYNISTDNININKTLLINKFSNILLFSFEL